MSDANAQDSHEGPIKTPKQLAWAVVASFLVPIVLIILMATFVASGNKPAAGSDAFSAESVARRLQPVGAIEIRDANAPAVLRTGEEVYKNACTACHAVGAAGAPKSGDVAAWAPRMTQSFELLVEHALKGKGAMPAQGGGDYSDFEIARAVHYMTAQAGGKFAEPKAPAPAAGASAAASAPAK